MAQLIWTLSFLVAALFATAQPANAFGGLTLCEEATFPTLVTYEDRALCGKLTVPEAPGSNDRMIELNIVWLPATTRIANPDPIVLLAGGPGQAVVSLGASWASRFENLRKTRAMLLVDQRGTGLSNSLACALSLAPTLEDIGLSGRIEEAIAAQTTALRDCLDELDADPKHYHSLAAADDLERVREALQLPTLNLFGVSYGTRMALVYARRYPESVRSLLLDAVAPTDMLIPLRVGSDADLAFEQIVSQCQQQPLCHEAYPDLPGLLRAAEADLANRQTLILTDSLTGVRETVNLDPRIINRLLRGAMYSRSLRQLIPLALREAAAGRWQSVIAIGELLSPDHDDGEAMSLGMMASVLCSEDMTQVDDQLQTRYFDNALQELLVEVCPIWPHTPVPQDYFEPVVTDLPTLLMSGRHDPITPPAYAESALAHLSQGRHLIAEGGAHGVSHLGCIPDLIETFLDTLAPKELDTECVDTILPQPFFLDYAGPFEPIKEQSDD